MVEWWRNGEVVDEWWSGREMMDRWMNGGMVEE